MDFIVINNDERYGDFLKREIFDIVTCIAWSHERLLRCEYVKYHTQHFKVLINSRPYSQMECRYSRSCRVDTDTTKQQTKYKQLQYFCDFRGRKML